jgi:hypothetical protein
MAEGVSVVKAAIVREFGAVSIREGHDSNTDSILLAFRADGRDFRVRVSREYDDDFASGQVKVDLKRLGATLRASKDGVASVTRAGITFQQVA